MNGALHLVCGPGRDGRSTLLEQRFNAPMHLSKPYWEERLLVANVVNSTAGLFAGDFIETDIDVCAGGEMLVTSASANRVHCSPSGFAQLSQSARVAAGGWLEVWPSILIPHAGSHYRQRTHLEVMPGGRLLWFEFFAPGRVASGEAWQFRQLENDFELTYDGRLIAKERFTLTPDSPAVTLLTQQFPTAYCASIYAAGAEMPAEIISSLAALHAPEAWVGCTQLRNDVVALRIVAAGSLQLSRTLTKSRELLHAGFGRAAVAVRRV